MKSALVLIFWVLFGVCFAQSVQQGKVMCYQGTNPKTPLSSVSIAATNASAVISDAEGAFTLNFRTLHPGDAIQFKRIELAGYEVMNQEALENARVANPNVNPNSSQNVRSGLTIILAKREMLRQLRDGYRSVASQRYEKQLKATEAQLEEMKKAGKIVEEQYNARMDSLEADYEEKLSKLETYIDKFARIDLSDLDADEQQIISLVQAGDFDEALKIYESQNLAQRLQKSREDQAKLVAAHDQLADAAHQKQIENDRLRASIARQVILLKMAGGEENYHKVHQILYATYLADTTHYEARKEYALTLRHQGDCATAIVLLRNGIDCEKDLYARGLMMADLMTCYWANGQKKAAYQMACLMDSLLTPIMETQYGVSTRCLPAWTSYQLCYLIQEDRVEECQPIVHRICQHWSPDTTRVENSLINFCNLIDRLSDYYSIVNDASQSVWLAGEAMRLGRCIDEKAPWTSRYAYYCAIACQTYMFQAMRAEGIDATQKAIVSMRKKLDNFCSRIVYNSIIQSASVLTEALVPSGEYAWADSVIQLINEYHVADHLNLRTEDGTLETYGLYRLYETQVLLHQGKIDEAEKVLQATVKLLSSSENGVYTLEMMQPEIEARIHLAKGQYAEAQAKCKQSIALNEEAYEESQDAWDADNLCRTYLLLHDIHQVAGRKSEAKKTLKKAEKVAVFPSNKVAIERVKNM